MRKCGIYKIVNLKNGKFYIGSCIDSYKRRHNHFSKLKRNCHPNNHLQASFNKYEEENFSFEMVAICPKEYLIKLEQWFIDNLKPVYNQCKVAGSRLGVPLTEDHKEKLRNARKGCKITEEHKRAIGDANKNKIFDLQYRLKLSQASKGRKKSEEAREKMRQSKLGKPSPRKGVKLSSELRQKLSEIAKRRFQ